MSWKRWAIVFVVFAVIALVAGFMATVAFGITEALSNVASALLG